MSLYDGPVIDAHHHLWDFSLGRHPWLLPPPDTGEMVFGSTRAIARDYLPADYLGDAAGQNLVASVHVEAGYTGGGPQEETRWLRRLPRPPGIAARFVARVELDHPDAGAQLAAEAAFPEVTGIRDIVAWHPDPGKNFARRAGLMCDPAWRRGLAQAGALGLSVDLMIYPWQMTEALELVQDFPQISFILNHCGSPADRSRRGMAQWREGLRALGACPNLSLKISDPVAYDPDWTTASLREVIDHCLACFDSSRAMFGSDFPVAGLHAGFGELYHIFRQAASALSPAGQRNLFHDTARRIYRLELKDDA